MGSMALSLPYAVDPNECPADDEADALDDDIAGSWEDEAATERISSALHTGVGGAGSLGHDVPSTSLAAAGRWTGSQGQGQGADELEDGSEQFEGTAFTGMADPATVSLCSQYLAGGSCQRGDDCPLIHGDLCEFCHRFALHPYDGEAAAQHTEQCRRRHERLTARLRCSNVECGICLEKVLSKANPSDRRFGLLECEHAFCLPCIRNWRSNGTADIDTAVRTCPVCRITTYVVVPSATWPSTPAEKESIIEGYHNRLATIPCKHFDLGQGTCPFGTSCLYRHVYKDGREDPKDPAALRRYADETGSVRVVNNIRLADFLDTPSARRALNGQHAGRRSRTRSSHEPEAMVPG